MMCSYEERTRELDRLRNRARHVCALNNICVGCLLTDILNKRNVCTQWKEQFDDEEIEVLHCFKRFPVVVEHGKP